MCTYKDSKVNILAEDFCIKDKFVGQTYDVTSIMSGHVNRLERKVRVEYPLAICTHCYAHVLNLVSQQDLCSIKECRKSSKRVDALQEFVDKKLLSVAAIRLNLKSLLSNAVQYNIFQLIDFFFRILWKTLKIRTLNTT